MIFMVVTCFISTIKTGLYEPVKNDISNTVPKCHGNDVADINNDGLPISLQWTWIRPDNYRKKKKHGAKTIILFIKI